MAASDPFEDLIADLMAQFPHDQQIVAALHPVSDATPDLAAAGRWRRDGWHDTACWQAWIADPERGCICA